MNEPSLQDKFILITGAGRAPAPRLARHLAGLGAAVAANDLSPALLDPLITAASARQERIQTYIADASRGMPLRAMLDEILGDFGRIDVLINNPRIRPEAPLLDLDEYDWQRTLELNLNGPFLIMQLVGRMMREQGGGTIINIADTNSAAMETAGRGAYAASQQGLLTVSQAAARELIAYNIRVYTLCPVESVFDCPAQEFESQPGEEAVEVFTRFAGFLCTSAAAHLAGQVFRVHSTGVDPDPGAAWQR